MYDNLKPETKKVCRSQKEVFNYIPHSNTAIGTFSGVRLYTVCNGLLARLPRLQ